MPHSQSIPIRESVRLCGISFMCVFVICFFVCELHAQHFSFCVFIFTLFLTEKEPMHIFCRLISIWHNSFHFLSLFLFDFSFWDYSKIKSLFVQFNLDILSFFVCLVAIFFSCHVISFCFDLFLLQFNFHNFGGYLQFFDWLIMRFGFVWDFHFLIYHFLAVSFCRFFFVLNFWWKIILQN